ncbi:MAG: SDR family oxidoreductase [Jatrophihabitans sp.]
MAGCQVRWHHRVMKHREDRRVALVTGASRGIGKATAISLARAGYDVAFTARTAHEGEGVVAPRLRRNGSATLAVPGSLETTKRLIVDCGAAALPISMDLLNMDSVRAAAATVHAKWGPVRVLVNNAIAHLPGSHDALADLELTELKAVLTANFAHQVVLTQAVLAGMVESGGGTIVNMSSGSATSDPPSAPSEGGWGLAYASSKAAFGRLSGAINAEYGHLGVRAFNVDPGFVVTEAAVARGGASRIADQGFEVDSERAAAEVIVWLAGHEEAGRFLGKNIWSPKLAAELGLLAHPE